ncbi:unnamed protein product [Bemisia tabaci]|uniref:Metalloendopeptidase n=1 Tax=Bemisia tabaci TaxID=7038 RepID=A0A9P0AKX4_BEMTA|nr:unnamed protein product [Bemisia tabaci]
MRGVLRKALFGRVDFILCSVMFIFVSVLLVFTERVNGRETILHDGQVHHVEDEFAEVRGKDLKLRSKKMLKRPKLLWRGAAVIYSINSSIGCPKSKRCSILMEAMRDFTEKTCVRFKERSGERDFVRIQMPLLKKKYFAHATLGKTGGRTFLQVHRRYWTKSMLLHELGHTLSLHHEHQRSDGDLYLDTLEENIRKGYEKHFIKHNRNENNLLGEPFDPTSIMVYSSYARSKNRKSKLPTQQLKSGERWGAPTKLSDGDVRRIQDLYRCIDGKGGFLKSEFKINGNQNPHTWSINFYGLSPLDIKRGPEGCISFIYQASKHMSLMLFKDELKTASDQVYDTKNSVEIWSNPEDPIPATNRKAWSQASIRVNVVKPFTLHFTSRYEDIVGLIGVVVVDDFELKYTPCENPTANGLNHRGSAMQRKFSWRAFLTTRRSSSSSSSSLRTSFSMSQAQTPSRGSPLASESAYLDSP